MSLIPRCGCRRLKYPSARCNAISSAGCGTRVSASIGIGSPGSGTIGPSAVAAVAPADIPDIISLPYLAAGGSSSVGDGISASATSATCPLLLCPLAAFVEGIARIPSAVSSGGVARWLLCIASSLSQQSSLSSSMMLSRVLMVVGPLTFPWTGSLVRSAHVASRLGSGWKLLRS